MESILDINIKNTELTIKEAFIRVIGEKYRDTVNKRLSHAIYINYNNFRGLKQYREYLLKTKRDILACNFFKTIGLDISKYEGIHEDSAYYQEFEELISTFFGSKIGFDITRYNLGVLSFKNDNNDPEDFVKLEQITFFNDYLFKGKEIIKDDNYDLFRLSENYRRIVTSVRTWIPLLEEKKEEYQEFKKSLEPLLEYIEDSEQRLNFIHDQNRIAVYNYIEKSLPYEWHRLLDKKYSDKKGRASILGDIDEYFGFAIFDPKYDIDLKSESTYKRKNVMEKRLKHFYNLGYLDTPISGLDPNLESIYESVMAKEETKLYIPSSSLRTALAKLKEELIKESEKALLIGDYYFHKKMSEMRFDEESINYIASTLSDTPILVSNGICNGEDYVFLYYTIRCFEGGMLDSILIHEFVHLFSVFIRKLGVISSGFDYLLTNEKKKNPYNDAYRLYERFNETITDIISQKVLFVLHEVFKVYLLEDKRAVRPSVNKNTHSVLRNLLIPFCNEYFDLIIEAFMEEDLNIILDEVGRDNFEKLVDIINYVDNLITNFNLVDDIERNNESSPYYGFYLKKVEEVIDLYEEMRNHKNGKKKALNY